LAGGTIIVADDHPLFRDALRQAIEGLAQTRNVALAGDYDGLEAAIAAAGEVELVLLDLHMPGNRGLTGLLRLRAEFPSIPVVIVSASDDATTIRRTLDLGASGFIPKSSTMAEIRAAIGAVLEGGIWLPPHLEADAGDGRDDADFSELAVKLKTLTPQQGKVLGMLAEWLLNKQI
jgi:DNA-binding NarL/FixJ family response regulator